MGIIAKPFGLFTGSASSKLVLPGDSVFIRFHRSVIGIATAGTSKENLGVFRVSTDLAAYDRDGVSGRLAQWRTIS